MIVWRDELSTSASPISHRDPLFHTGFNLSSIQQPRNVAVENTVLLLSQTFLESRNIDKASYYPFSFEKRFVISARQWQHFSHVLRLLSIENKFFKIFLTIIVGSMESASIRQSIIQPPSATNISAKSSSVFRRPEAWKMNYLRTWTLMQIQKLPSFPNTYQAVCDIYIYKNK